VFLGLLGCGSDPRADESSDASGVNRDPDGVYVFGREKWILASNGEQPYGYTDVWTSTDNESLHLEPSALISFRRFIRLLHWDSVPPAHGTA